LHELVAKVREGNPDSRPAVITVKSDPTAFLIINLGRENTVFVDSCSGELLGGPVSVAQLARTQHRLKFHKTYNSW
jgi:hypothetical protein